MINIKGRTIQWKAGVVLLVLTLLLAACVETEEEGAETAAPPEWTASSPVGEHEIDDKGEDAVAVRSDRLEDVIAAHNQLGWLVHSGLVRGEGEDGNVFISPLSVGLALGMVYNGAQGDTAAAIAEALQMADLDIAEVKDAHRGLMDAFAENLGVQLHVANGLWHRDSFELAAAYVDAVRTVYDAAIEGLDFADPTSVDVINEWVEDKTEGLIADLVDGLDDDLVTLLINTVYFKGDWTTPFDAAFTRDDTFHTASGAATMVPFMYRDGRFDHRLTEQFEAVRLPYGEDGRIAMYVFLPQMDVSLEDFAAFAGDEDGLFDGFENKLGEVHLPRLDVQYKTNLNDVLASLGMGIAFDPGRADLGAMGAASGGQRLFIGDVVHQSVLKVDEKGTEAAAATSVGVRMTSMPQYEFRFHANRPFFLAIRDDATGSLLFMGSIAAVK